MKKFGADPSAKVENISNKEAKKIIKEAKEQETKKKENDGSDS